MKYNINMLPDFYSVRNYEQIDYSLEGLEGKKCFAFFDNGFTSNVIEPNKRDAKFLWDGFLLFVDQQTTLEDIRRGVNLFDSRLVALQRTDLLGRKFNDLEVRSYITDKLEEKEIPIQVMKDKKEVSGYSTKCDLWSTRDASVLLDATGATGKGEAYYFEKPDFHFSITFNSSNLPEFEYQHKGAIVLKGENSTAISRLLTNNSNLQEEVKEIIGEEQLYSIIEQRKISGCAIADLTGIKTKLKTKGHFIKNNFFK